MPKPRENRGSLQKFKFPMISMTTLFVYTQDEDLETEGGSSRRENRWNGAGNQ